MRTFDLTKAKTPDNPNGADVVTRNGESVKITKIITPMLQNQTVLFPVIGEIKGIPYCWKEDGALYYGQNNYDLFLK